MKISVRNILQNQKNIVTLHPLFTHSRVMGNFSPVKQLKF